jgi:hypothetical protein
LPDSDTLISVNGDESICESCFSYQNGFVCDGCGDNFTTAENETQESTYKYNESDSLCDDCFGDYKNLIRDSMVARMFLTTGARQLWRRTIK